MNKTSQELWEEALRTAELLHRLRPTLESIEAAIAGVLPIDKVKLPVDYVADAEILTELLLALKARGARIA
jgi:hypothetical protein